MFRNNNIIKSKRFFVLLKDTTTTNNYYYVASSSSSKSTIITQLQQQQRLIHNNNNNNNNSNILLRRKQQYSTSSSKLLLLSSSSSTSTSSSLFANSPNLVLNSSLRFLLAQQQYQYQSPIISVQRYLSSTTTSTTTTTATTSTTTGNTIKSSSDNNNKSQEDEKKTSNTSGNIFLDYIGTIFLSGIGLIIIWLIRSYYNTKNKNLLRDNIENTSILDPIEISDIRLANYPDFNIQEYEYIINNYILLNDDNNLDTKMSYNDFVNIVRTGMSKIKGTPEYTIQLGHLLDRVVMDSNSHINNERPILYWLIVLSLAVCSSTTEIVNSLNKLINNGDDNNKQKQKQRIIEIVQYLQETYQLVPDAQIVTTTKKYPLQEYIIGTAEQLVDRAITNTNCDINDLQCILYSKSICAWGECYHQNKNKNKEIKK